MFLNLRADVLAGSAPSNSSMQKVNRFLIFEMAASAKVPANNPQTIQIFIFLRSLMMAAPRCMIRPVEMRVSCCDDEQRPIAKMPAGAWISRLTFQ